MRNGKPQIDSRACVSREGIIIEEGRTTPPVPLTLDAVRALVNARWSISFSAFLAYVAFRVLSLLFTRKRAEEKQEKATATITVPFLRWKD